MKHCGICPFALLLCLVMTNNARGQTPTTESLNNAVVTALQDKWIVAIGMLDQLDRLNEVVEAFVRKNDPKAEIGRR